jgi:hypothetical protein
MAPGNGERVLREAVGVGRPAHRLPLKSLHARLDQRLTVDGLWSPSAPLSSTSAALLADRRSRTAAECAFVPVDPKLLVDARLPSVCPCSLTGVYRNATCYPLCPVRRLFVLTSGATAGTATISCSSLRSTRPRARGSILPSSGTAAVDRVSAPVERHSGPTGCPVLRQAGLIPHTDQCFRLAGCGRNV